MEAEDELCGVAASIIQAAWRRWRLRPRVLVDVSAVCTRTTLQLGGGRQLQLASPLLAAPMATASIGSTTASSFMHPPFAAASRMSLTVT